MKKLLIIFASITLLVSSQEIDQAYLESLPEDVRDDVLNKIDQREEIEKPVYRRASTKIDKTESKIGVFGESFFDTMQTTFMPVNEPNMDASYILDFGDEIQVQLIGQEDSIESHTINRDGSINMAEIGKIVLAGLSLAEASSFIKAKVDNAYIGTQAFVSLVRIRDINVLIAGNAFNPGVYTLSGNANMLHALNMAGGINEYGSYRNISLVRDGKIINTLDIYDVLINGNLKFNERLRSGDSIVVQRVGTSLSILSGVNRPSKYELKEDENLYDLINYANGLNTDADISNINMKTSISGSNNLVKIEYDNLGKYEYKDEDSLFISEFKYNSIKIEGAIKNPGIYKIAYGTKLSEVIEISGGYEESAYPFAGYLNNQRAFEINQIAKEKLYDTFLNNLITNSSTKNIDESIGLILQQLKNAAVYGRVIAEFDTDVIYANPELDTILEDGDEIIIPSTTQQVYVQGEVSNPGAVRYSSMKDLEYYINNAGGYLQSSDSDTIFIVHPNGQTINLNSKGGRLSFLSSENSDQLIYPGSIIFVPRSTNFANPTEVASIWAPIISSIALSLTSLSVLNNSN